LAVKFSNLLQEENGDEEAKQLSAEASKVVNVATSVEDCAGCHYAACKWQSIHITIQHEVWI
jgi:hypothetical protein